MDRDTLYREYITSLQEGVAQGWPEDAQQRTDAVRIAWIKAVNAQPYQHTPPAPHRTPENLPRSSAATAPTRATHTRTPKPKRHAVSPTLTIPDDWLLDIDSLPTL